MSGTYYLDNYKDKSKVARDLVTEVIQYGNERERKELISHLKQVLRSIPDKLFNSAI